MTLMLEFKEKIKRIYAEFSHILLPVGKFLLAMVTFFSINQTVGFLPLLNNVFVMLILALICCLLPVNVIAVVAGIMIIAHCYALGIEVAGFVLLLLIIIGIFFLRFVSRDSLAMILTPLAFGLGIPCAIPLCCGLKRKPGAAIAVGCGTLIYYLMELLKEKSAALKGADKSEIITKIRLLLDGIIKNRIMMLNLLALVAVLILVYAVRRTGIDYAWRIAIGVGLVAYLAIMVSGGLFLDMSTSVPKVVLGAVVSGFIALIMEFLVMNVDYSRPEHLEYEDDEYYYYVKAVPKMSITKAKRQIKTISSLGENRESVDIDSTDLEQKLEESLKDL